MYQIERAFRSIKYRRRECNRYTASKSVFNTFYTRAGVALSTLSSNRLCPANWNFVCWRYFNIRRVEIFRKEATDKGTLIDSSFFFLSNDF